MSHDFVRMTFSCAIEALLGEGSIQKRLSDADPYISRLEHYRAEIPDEQYELLAGIVTRMAHFKRNKTEHEFASEYLSPDQELELAEELLELYVLTTGGVLMP
jgi:hypothetical protein